MKNGKFACKVFVAISAICFQHAWADDGAAQGAVTAKPLTEICGLVISNRFGTSVSTEPILESSLKNRVDSERFNACPYWATLKAGKLKTRIDFSSKPTQEDLAENSGTDIYVGGFVFEGGEWVMHDDFSKPDKSVKITVYKNDMTTFVLANRYRKESNDTCIDFVAIGPSRSAMGGGCSKSESELAPLTNFLNIRNSIFFKK